MICLICTEIRLKLIKPVNMKSTYFTVKTTNMVSVLGSWLIGKGNCPAPT